VGNMGGLYTLVDCDLCGASLLGSGEFVNRLEKLKEIAPARGLFSETMDNYMESALYVEDNHYFRDKATVLAELDQMLASSAITDAQKEKLKESRDKIDAGENIQFNCANGGCTWEGI
jgi:hypothetical protein